jgi:hypothetical protein
MSTRSNTHPYTNANRAGRTQPGLIEIIEKSDPRALGVRYVPNRATLRAQGVRGATRVATVAQAKRGNISSRLPGLNPRTAKTVRLRCQHGTVLPYPWSVRAAYCGTCHAEVDALNAVNHPSPTNPLTRSLRRVLGRLRGEQA